MTPRLNSYETLYNVFVKQENIFIKQIHLTERHRKQVSRFFFQDSKTEIIR